MTIAVCFKCGANKTGAFAKCDACGISPIREGELAFSLILCEPISSVPEITQYAIDLKRQAHPKIPEVSWKKASTTLKDPKLMAMLGLKRPTVSSTPQSTSAEPNPGADPPPSPQPIPIQMAKETVLHKNPFWILGATTRDNRQRIVELAEEKALSLDPDVCQKARSDLTTPRNRLSAELAWFPGVSPRKAEQLAQHLLHIQHSSPDESGLPDLAHANLLAAAFDNIDERFKPEEIALFIQEFSDVVSKISLDEVIRDINEDRAISGFPEINNVEQVESELKERKIQYRIAIKNALDRLEPSSIVQVMSIAVENATSGGTEHAPELIDDLVDSYESEARQFLQAEADNIQTLIETARKSAPSGEVQVQSVIDRIESVTRNWVNVAYPVQLSAKARGIAHKQSTEMAYAIRSLGIDLFNEHNMASQSNRIVGLLKTLFSEIPEVAERVEEDSDALAKIIKERTQAKEGAKAREAEWAQEITYHAEIGLIFKDNLGISPDGVYWKSYHFALDSITRVRWGGIRRSVNGIPSGTTYTIAFGDQRTQAIVELSKEEIYSAFLERFWRGVCVRLLTDILKALKQGAALQFEDAKIVDDGITLCKTGFFSANEQIKFSWSQVHVWNADGSFFIGSRENKKFYTKLSYINTNNTHLLEQAIRIAFEKGFRRLSELL